MICQKGERKKIRYEKCKVHHNASICKYCNKKHPAKKEGECWELEANAASRPSNWISFKSTRRCAGPQEETEMWQPGKVLLNKICTNNTYLATTNFWAPLEIEEEDNKQPKEEINIINTKATKQIETNKWMQRVEERRATRIKKQMIINSAATSNFISGELDLPKQEHQKSQYTYQITPHFRLPTKPCYHLNNNQRKQERSTYSQDSKSLS
jgi:hypothetical protein